MPVKEYYPEWILLWVDLMIRNLRRARFVDPLPGHMYNYTTFYLFIQVSTPKLSVQGQRKGCRHAPMWTQLLWWRKHHGARKPEKNIMIVITKLRRHMGPQRNAAGMEMNTFACTHTHVFPAKCDAQKRMRETDTRRKSEKLIILFLAFKNLPSLRSFRMCASNSNKNGQAF